MSIDSARFCADLPQGSGSDALVVAITAVRHEHDITLRVLRWLSARLLFRRPVPDDYLFMPGASMLRLPAWRKTPVEGA
ncbi:MAG: hypothetical protein U1F76_01430 [Candidatus Competibacteraceae bacterium]